MKSLRLSLVAATLASVLSASALAQSVTELQAGALLQSAERLSNERADAETVSAAYQKALMAYDELANTEKSLEILGTLVDIHYGVCEDDEAIRWAEDAVARFLPPQRNFDLNDRLFGYAGWLDRLGRLYGLTGQPESAADMYAVALNNLQTIPPRVDRDFSLTTEAEFLRSQLTFYPSDSEDAIATRERLMEVRQRSGTIHQVDGLLADATFLSRSTEDSFSSAVELLQQAWELSHLNNYPSGKLQATVLLGQQALQATDYSQALSYGSSALTDFNTLQGAETWLTDARYVLAQAHQELGNDIEAIGYYTDLLKLIDSEPEFRINVNKSTVVTELIALYERTGQLALANELATANESLLNSPFPRLSRLPSVSSLSRLRRPPYRSRLWVRFCDDGSEALRSVPRPRFTAPRRPTNFVPVLPRSTSKGAQP